MVAACTQQNNSTNTVETLNSNGIIGGEAAKSTDPVAASTVSLMYYGFGAGQSFCTGTVISKNLILTATHCLQDMEAEDIKVFFGTNLPTFGDEPNLRAVKTMVTHPDYNFGLDPVHNLYTGANDVGLIMIEGEIPEFAKPVPVMKDAPINVGQSLLLSGFGLVNETTSPPQRATGLNYTRVTVAKTYANILVTEQSKANGACAGDSGGPAFLETDNGLMVLGITRGPYNLAPNCRQWGEYTYASRFEDYILRVASEMGAELPQFVAAPSTALTPALPPETPELPASLEEMPEMPENLLGL